MKDLLNREVQVGQYIAYALTVGRSANLAVYRVVEVLENKIKAVKVTESYGFNNRKIKLQCGTLVPYKYCIFKYVENGKSEFVEMTQEQKDKVDNKTSTLSMPERIFILDGFDPSLFED